MGIMEPRIISKETIKPSSPTPSHLRTYSLSLLDQLSPHIYLPMLLFYPNEDSNNNPSKMAEKSHCLKTSLSETLTRYYPFAGRLVDGATIECNDEGVDYYEARVDNCKLSDILEKPEPETLNLLYPNGSLFNEAYQGSLTVVQVTYFDCGGIAIAFCALHKIADGAGVSALRSDWAAFARLGGDEMTKRPSPVFISKFIPPPKDTLPLLPETKLEMMNCVTRRYVFDAAKIAELKAIAADHSGVLNPSRVEVVTALIFKCATAACRANSGSSRPSVLLQPVNLRPRTSPPLPDNSVGNFSWFFSVMAKDERDNNLGGLVGAMKKAMAQIFEKYAKTPEECYSLVCEAIKEATKVINKNDNVDVFKSTSLCRYPFSQLDYGWGKPSWVGFYRSSAKNTFLLIDARAGGVEAWVTLEEQVMAVFECDEELLEFASLNPSALETDYE